MMACVGIVGFNDMSVSLSDNMAFRRQNFSESVPSVAIENAVFEMFQFGVEPLESLLITLSKYPRNCSTCAAVNCLDDPQLSFFLTI